MSSINRRLTANRDRRVETKLADAKWLSDFKEATIINSYKKAGMIPPAGLMSNDPYVPTQRRVEVNPETGERQYVWYGRKDNKWQRL